MAATALKSKTGLANIEIRIQWSFLPPDTHVVPLSQEIMFKLKNGRLFVSTSLLLERVHISQFENIEITHLRKLALLPWQSGVRIFLLSFSSGNEF